MTRMGKQEIGIMSRRVGIHEISLQNLYVDTGALRVKDLYINYHARYSCQNDGSTCRCGIYAAVVKRLV